MVEPDIKNQEPEPLPDPEFKEMDAPTRRHAIADWLMGSPAKVTQAELASAFGVSQPMIARDLRSEEYAQAAISHIRGYLRGDLFPRAFAVIRERLVSEDKAVADETAKWLIAKMAKFIDSGPGISEHQASLEALKLIINGDDDQVAALQDRNATLELELAELKARINDDPGTDKKPDPGNV